MRPTPFAPAMAFELGYEIYQRQLFPVEGRGEALFEADLDVLRLVGGVLGGCSQLEHVFRGLVVGVFEWTCLDGAAPEVLVHAVGGLFRGRDGDAVLLGVGHLLGAVHVPVAHRGDDGQVGGDGGRRHVEADLVVALARRAVGDVGGPDLPRGLDQLLRDERARQGRKERVFSAVERVRLYGGGDVLVRELRLRVAHEGVRGAYPQCLRPHVVGGLSLAEVHVQGVGHGSLFLQPLHADRGIQSARVGEHDLLSF